MWCPKRTVCDVPLATLVGLSAQQSTYIYFPRAQHNTSNKVCFGFISLFLPLFSLSVGVAGVGGRVYVIQKLLASKFNLAVSGSG